ncbi:MAG: Maf family nucleotide pyrophosphatase [Bacteroidota bacterium]
MVLIEKLSDYRIILASQSPRRKQLLEGLGLKFEVIVREVDETAPPELVREQIPLYLAEKKAKAFDPDEFGPKSLIITADTIVWLSDQMLNKPTDFDSAVEMLTLISGGMHEVFTGVCLRTNTHSHSFFAESKVTFRHLDHAEIVHYINECQPFDKAGAYGIQEWIGYIGIEHIEGSFYNVMGLPTQMLYKELNAILQ